MKSLNCGKSLILHEVVEKRVKDAPLSFDRYYMYIGDKKKQLKI